MKLFLLLFLCVIVSFRLCHGQDVHHGTSEDELFRLARQKAIAKPFAESRQVLASLLGINPAHYDARVLLARIHAWNGDYDSARKELQMVLQAYPYHEDALRALTDVEMWDENFGGVLRVTNTALEKYVHDPEFLLKRARAFYAMKNPDEATAVLKLLLEVHDGHVEAKRLLSEITHAQKKNYVGMSYGLDIFNEVFSPAHHASVFGSRKNEWGTVVLNGNFSSRFHETDWQGEAEVYPKIYKGIYGYLNYGYSGGKLFPKHRAGAELYFSIPRNLEVSGGIRYLDYRDNRSINIFTGSVGWYGEKYSVLGRLFLTPDAIQGTGTASFIQLKRMRGSRDEYVGLNASIGFTPDERTLQTSTGLAAESIFNLKSQSIGLDWSHFLGRDFIFLINLKLSRQQFIFDAGEYVTFGTVDLRLRKGF
ncbi:MAG TPA: YaiO family outer membrane beta-barrel protein [Chryseosolibacter sp.]|nr:YaiO family outer membrane beta-barrel protein [Chryseosolibacter sp.]